MNYFQALLLLEKSPSSQKNDFELPRLAHQLLEYGLKPC